MTSSVEQARSLERALRGALRGEVDFGTAQRAVYAYDASNYRQVPLGVVKPASSDDVRAAVALAREHGVPVLARGAGTSIGGQAVSPGALVLDLRARFAGVTEVDPQARTARVLPGTVLDSLQAAARPHGLVFGPDPSTHSRCTLGGMIGNDSCGPHSVVWGRTADNVRSLDLLLADGTELTVSGPLSADERAQLLRGTPGRAGELLRGLHALAEQNLGTLRQDFPQLPRRVSGYALDALLPERGFDLARALTGTEGTCALLLGATVALAPLPSRRVLVVAGYADESATAEAVLELLPLRPLTAEGMGGDLVPGGLAGLTGPGGWLLLEAEAGDHARAVERAVRAQGAAVAVVEDPVAQRAVWRVREAAAGTATRAPDGSEAWPGWEDTAVPPERLAGYLRELRELMAAHGLQGTPFGHFGEGCVHLRIDFDLDRPQNGRFRGFLTGAADLVVRHGGSLSGEHGDGQARGELLARMYPPRVIELFGAFKALWDPANLLNPGNLVDPRPFDADLRQPALRRELFPELTLTLVDGARRCVGVGACVTDDPATVMCPSYAVTREERHSTRGRARLLGELLRGDLVTDGWRSREVREALDLCFACKACASDCPVHVDMATYKSEFLHRFYRHRPRPRIHWTLGGLPRNLRLLRALRLGRPVGALARSRFGPLLAWLAGTTRQRPLPPIPARAFTEGTITEGAAGAGSGGRPVLLWPDTFGNHLQPEVLRAATTVLRRFGFRPVLPQGPVCCGLTQTTTGRLDAARRTRDRTLRTLAPLLDADPQLPIVVLEPSCAAELRAPHSPLADRVRTFAELLDEQLDRVPELVAALAVQGKPESKPDSKPESKPDSKPSALVQTHCHQHAVLGTDADRRLAARLGLDLRQLPPSCCGLAGDFGFEPGHEAVSVAAAERVLLPALRAEPDATVLADGFSCRTQIAQLADGRRALHLAEWLERMLPQEPLSDI
ncbi:FAD-binding and (Fe-S)-binding domain-containing protein [Streptacidiphilus fuscans]|uniref:FAD-binding oxidoreductase n=1 Tax=Streptacidiphilus fuscans TaxID=2789292 RepID=A0A931BB65_9ACTN|nr:FAD-binding and (Fe-S)-binding domain-containing protein [Streptacidiphilus fuscans]MBF9070200.1 FAD-binding oxidoreductase [Streptacidiphilus fuscans]